MAIRLDQRGGFKDLSPHVGHDIEIVAYGSSENVAIECITCGLVLLDFDRPGRGTPNSVKFP